MASYQTDLLGKYSTGFQSLALEIFNQVRNLVPAEHCVTHKGSYTISGSTTPEVAAKILIHERGRGRDLGSLPPLDDGVYVLVRVGGPAGTDIWSQEAAEKVFPQFFGLMSRTVTIGVGPAHDKRFAYFRVTSPSDPRLVASYLGQVVLLIDACYRLA